MPTRPQVPDPILSALSRICLAFPETREEQAWIGVRWRVRTQTFAHVLMLDRGWPPAYAKAAGTDGPACLLTFRSWERPFAPPELDAPPFFWPGWWPDIVGMKLGETPDWAQIERLLQMSYRVMAPRKLSARLESADGA